MALKENSFKKILPARKKNSNDMRVCACVRASVRACVRLTDDGAREKERKEKKNQRKEKEKETLTSSQRTGSRRGKT